MDEGFATNSSALTAAIIEAVRSKNAGNTDDLILNWIRNRNTIEFLGIWEQLNNPDFNLVEFDGFW